MEKHLAFNHERMSLCEVLDRVLNTGVVVVVGEIVISVAGVGLIYLNLKLLLTSVETARGGRLTLIPRAQTESLQESA